MRNLLPLLVFGLNACLSVPCPLSPGFKGSLGWPSHGVQTGAIELPVKGKGFERYRPESDHYWGQPRLVRAIQHIAARLSEQLGPGPPLLVGDLSARGGGRLPGHASHRNGRDVDLLLFTTSAAGARTRTPGFVAIGADALGQAPGSGEFVRLDIARQWQLVRELLTSSEIAVQFLFVSRDVEAMLIDYALSRGEPLDLVWQAETVLLQPRDSTAHDDHMHLRIVCNPEDTVRGCGGGGPRWEWLPPEPKLSGMAEAELAALLREDPLPPVERVAQRAAARGSGAP